MAEICLILLKGHDYDDRFTCWGDGIDIHPSNRKSKLRQTNSSSQQPPLPTDEWAHYRTNVMITRAHIPWTRWRLPGSWICLSEFWFSISWLDIDDNIPTSESPMSSQQVEQKNNKKEVCLMFLVARSVHWSTQWVLLGSWMNGCDLRLLRVAQAGSSVDQACSWYSTECGFETWAFVL